MHLGQCRHEHRRPAFQVNEVGLLALGILRVDYPFVPPVGHHQRPPLGPQRLEELAGGHRLHPRIDRRGPLAGGPERRPAPMARVDAQAVGGVVQDQHAAAGGDVVTADGPVVVAADVTLCDVQRTQIVGVALILGEASTHGVCPPTLS